ncbi:MAG: hypothetical protein FWD68_09845 [Alphaproteobacteria bacterium]|nr:hypothetical protein [Alphaproteobacteria bacterium]
MIKVFIKQTSDTVKMRIRISPVRQFRKEGILLNLNNDGAIFGRQPETWHWTGFIGKPKLEEQVRSRQIRHPAEPTPAASEYLGGHPSLATKKHRHVLNSECSGMIGRSKYAPTITSSMGGFLYLARTWIPLFHPIGDHVSFTMEISP